MSTKQRDFQEEAVRNLVWRCCVNCVNFAPEKLTCELYNVQPPADIIVKSCPLWVAIVPF